MLSITHNSKLDKMLRREKKYSFLFENTIDACVSVDMDGRVTEFNEIFQKMVGYEPKEIYQLTYKDITPKKWHAFEAEIIKRQVLTRGYSDIYEKEYRRKDGTIFPVELRTSLIRDKEGKPSGMWMLACNISKRKKAEEALKESQDKYRALVDAVPNVISITTLDGKVLGINNIIKEMSGYTPDEFKELNINDIYADPSDRKLLVASLKGKGKVRNFKTKLKRKEGTIFFVVINADLIELDNQKLILTTVRDITESKQVEDKLRQRQATLEALFNATHDRIQLLDAKGSILNINEAGARSFGKTREALIECNIYSLMLPDLAASRKKYTDNVFATGTPVQFEDMREGKYLNNSIYPVFNSQGSSVESVAVFSLDITRRKKAEIALQAARDYAENLIQTANVMVVGLDRSGKVQVFNKVAEKITGFTKNELEGRNWFDVVVPRNRYPEVWKEFQRLMKGNLPRKFYNSILTKSGEERYIIWQNNQVLEQGKIVGMISFGVDALGQIFTENREFETKGESVLKAMIKKVISQAVIDVFANVIPSQYEDSNIVNEIGILNKAAVGANKRPWENVFVVGQAIMQSDLTTREIAEQLKCNRSTAYRIIKRLEGNGFVEKKGTHYTLSEKNCPLLYYLCRKKALSRKIIRSFNP